MGLENPIVFLDVKIGDEKVGRIIIELFANIVPKTAENFLVLCIGSHISPITRKKLHFKGTIFHKVIPGVFIQGGDVINFDGTSGESIYGSPFKDENYKLKHDQPGMLSAVNSGQNSNTSQFIITLDACPHLDGSSVVFGKILKGLACAIEISEVRGENDCPSVKCVIEDCGQLLLGEPWNYIEDDGTQDVFPPDPRDLDIKKFELSDFIETIIKIRESGNIFFLKQNFSEANRKYKKAVRYVDYWINQPRIEYLDPIKKSEIRKELDKEKMTCFLNSAAVALKNGLYRHSLNLCDEVLKKEKNNPKAHFRRGKALKYLNDYEGALVELRKALDLVPNDKCIMDEMNKINDLIKNYLVQEKKVFSRMFSSHN